MFALTISKTASQNLTVTSECIEPGTTVQLTCETIDFASAVLFYLNGDNKGGCTTISCGTSISGYSTPTQSGTSTEMTISNYNHSRDGGDWTCSYGVSTSSPPYKVELGNCKATSNSLETEHIVGIVIGSVVIVCIIAGTVFALYLNGLLCFATCPIQKEATARAGSKVQLLPELTSIQNIMSTEWTHAGNIVKTGNENELMQMDGTIPWVSPRDSGLWHCKLKLYNANDQNFDIRLNVTVHQYEADAGMRVQLLDYMKKSPAFQSVEWYHKEFKIHGNELKYQGGTIQVPALYVDKLEEGDAGEYTCKILFKSATLEIPVKLAVKSKGNSSLPPFGTTGLNTGTS